MENGVSVKGFQFEQGEIKIELIDTVNGLFQATFSGISGDPDAPDYPKLNITNGKLKLTEYSNSTPPELPKQKRGDLI